MRTSFDRVLTFVLLTGFVAACRGNDDEGADDLGSAEVGDDSASVGGQMKSATSPTAKGGRGSADGAKGGDATTSEGSTENGGSGPSSTSGGSTVSPTTNTVGGTAARASGSGGSTSRRTNSSSATGTTGGAATGGTGKNSNAATGGAVKGSNTSGGNSSGSSSVGGTSSTRSGKASGGTSGGTSSSSNRGGNNSVGGAASGGSAAGGNVSAGGQSGGNSTGVCTPNYGEVPSNVSAWVEESWKSELGQNVKNRQAWLLDSVMLGKGQINLCVRWGATSAPTAAVKAGMVAAVEKWFNDWFAQLKDYACFPHSKITTKVTGWAVKPGNTSWVSDLGNDVKIYTETDAEGEPKCPDSCSFFTNWSHSFPKCAGGEAFHHDYWLWLDDAIGGGAAAVGGDWGLRMPVKNFVASMGKSDFVIEHEMGHGFGFQDYYSWTGSKPAGGSLMIVGSTSNPSPTTGDTWLLRRAWKESKAMRGW